ncbi:hypothetical protein WJX72_000652 [[Myrmecia] bisecta]|uniref:Uncharacterized protein n=1 Tax=[Myrmecia] bisecta TaxID=41462 RepID=A0AAW1QA26_9CHLO
MRLLRSLLLALVLLCLLQSAVVFTLNPSNRGAATQRNPGVKQEDYLNAEAIKSDPGLKAYHDWQAAKLEGRPEGKGAFVGRVPPDLLHQAVHDQQVYGEDHDEF